MQAQDAVVALNHAINHLLDQPDSAEAIFIFACAIPEIVTEATLSGETVDPLLGAFHCSTCSDTGWIQTGITTTGPMGRTRCPDCEPEPVDAEERFIHED